MAASKTLSAPATSSQPSRKGKRAWRKNVDISEVQQGLEELQAAQIQHGGVLAEKDAGELFATDLAGDEDLAKQQRQQGGKKLLKAEEILALRSAVPGLEGKKRKKGDGDAVGTNSSSKRLKTGTYVSHKELQRLKAVADRKGVGVAVDATEEGATHDPWAPPLLETKDPQFDFLDLDTAQPPKKKEPKTLKQAPASLTPNGRRIPHVPVPDPGKSYNPTVEDWSALLSREGAAAVDAEKARLQAEAEEAEKAARIEAEAAKVEAAEREDDIYSNNDYDSAWESEWEGFQSGREEEVHAQKQKGRKTPAERKKVQARKEREARAVRERKEKERVKQEREIARIAREVSARDKARKAHIRTLEHHAAADKDEGEAEAEDGAEEVDIPYRPRFGKLPLPEPSLEVVLPEELEDSLRRLKPEGDLLRERYRNLLVGGKVEVRRRRQGDGSKKRAKGWRSEKWSYKDWRLG